MNEEDRRRRVFEDRAGRFAQAIGSPQRLNTAAHRLNELVHLLTDALHYDDKLDLEGAVAMARQLFEQEKLPRKATSAAVPVSHLGS